PTTPTSSTLRWTRPWTACAGPAPSCSTRPCCCAGSTIRSTRWPTCPSAAMPPACCRTTCTSWTGSRARRISRSATIAPANCTGSWRRACPVTWCRSWCARSRAIRASARYEPGGASVLQAPQQHRVAVGEEAVALLHRMAVGGEDPLLPGEGRDQHQQRAFRQVEVGHQRVHAADPVAGEDEDPGLAGERLQFAIAHRALQRAHHGRAHRDHPPAGSAGAADLRHQFGADVEPLAVHGVLAHVLYPHRLEGARAHV